MRSIPSFASCTACFRQLRNVQNRWRGHRCLGGRLVPLVLLVFLVASLVPMEGMGPRRFYAGETEKGLASWYGAEQQGVRTADGERFNRHELTAAHRHLPFNTMVRVTNQQNGKSVEVRINDRGPFRGGRIIDVSEAAAVILDMKRPGTVPVLIEIIQLGSPGRVHHG